MKRCWKCKQTKDESEFGKDKSKKDGLYEVCKSCKRIFNQKYYVKMTEEQKKKHYSNRYAKKKSKRVIKPRKSIVCNLIKQHHEEMKDDPERLSTEFMQNLLGRKCQ